eukprot:13835743-Alexandrium_andersonii.AAC.1
MSDPKSAFLLPEVCGVLGEAALLDVWVRRKFEFLKCLLAVVIKFLLKCLRERLEGRILALNDEEPCLSPPGWSHRKLAA